MSLPEQHIFSGWLQYFACVVFILVIVRMFGFLAGEAVQSCSYRDKRDKQPPIHTYRQSTLDFF